MGHFRGYNRNNSQIPCYGQLVHLLQNGAFVAGESGLDLPACAPDLGLEEDLGTGVSAAQQALRTESLKLLSELRSAVDRDKNCCPSAAQVSAIRKIHGEIVPRFLTTSKQRRARLIRTAFKKQAQQPSKRKVPPPQFSAVASKRRVVANQRRNP